MPLRRGYCRAVAARFALRRAWLGEQKVRVRRCAPSVSEREAEFFRKSASS